MNEAQLQRKKWLQKCETCKTKRVVWEESQTHTQIRIASLYERIDMKDGEDNDRRIPAKIHCRAYRYEG